MNETRSVCCYCGTGCGVIIQENGGRIVGVRGDPDHPANFGILCSKGSTLHLTTQLTGRAMRPELRTARGAARAPVSWDAALDTAADRFAGIIAEHGPDAVAFYISGQLLTEDYYVFNKLARALVGTNNIDSNSRLCMSSAVAGYKATLGSDAVPCCYDDIALADLFLLAGSNTAWAHPILFRRIEDARAANLELKIVVVDPRRTDTAAMADLHLAISPGSDVLLYSAMLHVMLWEGLMDQGFIAGHTSGFAELQTRLREMTPGAVAAACGVSADSIVQAARWFGTAKAPLSMWCQGLNQSFHGTDNNAALIHLHLATGKIGRPGMGPFSLTGQPNAMGGRESGSMATLLPGHRDLSSANDREELADLWQVPEIPGRPGKTAVEMFDALRDGTIKAVWIACTNPAQSLPDQTRVREALEAAEFVVLQEAFAGTETAAYADLVLPAATWGEKEGTMTNSERRISRVRAAVAAPGEARPDWSIAADFARRLALRLPMGATSLFDFSNEAEVYQEHVLTTRGRDLDIGGLSHDVLNQRGPQQWPFPAGSLTGQARLYADQRFATDDGRARFVALNFSPTAEATDARFPLHLTNGRLRDQWHGMSRTGRSARLTGHEPVPRVVLNRADLERRGIGSGDLIRIKSRRGEIVLPAVGSDDVRPGLAFFPMHWGGRSLSHAGINQLIQAVVDPISKQPELKHAAIRIEPVSLPYRMVVLRSAGSAASGDERLLDWQARLQPGLSRFAYAALTLAGRDCPLLVLSIAHPTPLPDVELAQLADILEFGETTDYRDPARGIVKRARIDADSGVLAAILLAGEIAAAGWLQDLMGSARPLGGLSRWLFAPTATPPDALPAAGRTVCSCFGVTETQIRDQLVKGGELARLQTALKCGTSCGSCLPELRRMAG